MKDSKDIEQILLNEESYDKFVNTKIENEFEENIKSSDKNKGQIVMDIKLVPKNKIFSKNATYIVMNKKSKTKSYISGVQAEGFTASSSSREKLLSGKTDYFISGDSYIKFYKAKI